MKSVLCMLLMVFGIQAFARQDMTCRIHEAYRDHFINTGIPEYGPTRVPNVYDYATVDDEKWDRHAAPVAWRETAISRHQLIYKLTKEAVAGNNVKANVRTIFELIDNPIGGVSAPERNSYTTNDIAEEALGEIGDASVAVPLMMRILTDIDRNKDIVHDKKIRRHFFALEAIASLNFSGQDGLRDVIQDFLIELNDKDMADHSASNGYMGVEGLGNPAFNTPKTREYLLNVLGQNRWTEWSVMRVFQTWKSPTVLPALLKRMETKEMDELSVSYLTGLFAYHYKALKDVGLDRADVYARLKKVVETTPLMVNYPEVALAIINPVQCPGDAAEL